MPVSVTMSRDVAIVVADVIKLFVKQESQGTVLLLTASGLAVSNSNELVPVRALLDNGSQRSYIKTKLKNRFGFTALKKEPVSLKVFGS